ncbi:hypothetical protein BXY82_0588 [Gelidibacter sediminis]|uniref:Uncharacterized protein n=1 Tax=Gelidibacter sediminis TaxID=1608710 RepID=A0A4R7Q8Q3_9FLAO|nr:hypothetical protein [Gelidibacter sediminis]TDU43181.1 hypothetical protein BXY82_0588 [Gelidibacter sediminis]
MKNWIIVLFLCLGTLVSAQEVISNGKVYEVKGKSIFKDGIDITASLESSEKDAIFKTLKNQQKEASRAEAARKKLEKAAKKSEKAQKRAANELKKKQKAQDKFEKAAKRLEQNQEKYERLKMRGKLSPNDDAKWLKKLERYTKDLDKATKALRRS